MRYVLLFILAFIIGQLIAQTAFTSANFEAEVLAYQPNQRPGVDDKNFDFGTMVLRETVRQTKGDAAAFNRADYINILSSFLALGETKEDTRLAFERFRASEGSCEYLTNKKFKKDFEKKHQRKMVTEWWAVAETGCYADGYQPEERTAAADYAATNGLDAELLRLIERINEDDQRFRKGEYQPNLQTPLDRENERLVDSLFGVYGTYLGNSLVGEAYNSVMWLVIQHSRPATMERYLPVVHAAVGAEELPEAPLRMLIDRTQHARTGQQVFGSQVGVPLLPEAEREEILSFYGLD